MNQQKDKTPSMTIPNSIPFSDITTSQLKNKISTPVISVPISPFSNLTNFHIQENSLPILESGSANTNVPNSYNANTITSISSVNKLSNRWTSSETRFLIKEVEKNQQALQQVRDLRQKGQIWDKIIANLQESTVASVALKGRTKMSIQQKWESLHQKYRSIKNTIKNTGEGAIQTKWEFFNDMEEILKNDPSIIAPVTSNSINRIKHKQDNQEEDEKKKHLHNNEKANIEEFRILIKEQTEMIIETIKDQYTYTSEIQQKQHAEQMDIFRQFLTKF
ncbi:1593_t:CDS:2 [Scutellospora calospora]|uniref:1593_t:CDS:1 n=1 Tax=Scutellospora calospora TaxID=85575 RepID=A0ACA9LER6_9GLOM|nr:1593_t:CDS:2 [Scutellospora calospora]